MNGSPSSPSTLFPSSFSNLRLLFLPLFFHSFLPSFLFFYPFTLLYLDNTDTNHPRLTGRGRGREDPSFHTPVPTHRTVTPLGGKEVRRGPTRGTETHRTEIKRETEELHWRRGRRQNQMNTRFSVTSSARNYELLV